MPNDILAKAERLNDMADLLVSAAKRGGTDLLSGIVQTFGVSDAQLVAGVLANRIAMTERSNAVPEDEI